MRIKQHPNGCGKLWLRQLLRHPRQRHRKPNPRRNSQQALRISQQPPRCAPPPVNTQPAPRASSNLPFRRLSRNIVNSSRALGSRISARNAAVPSARIAHRHSGCPSPDFHPPQSHSTAGPPSPRCARTSASGTRPLPPSPAAPPPDRS